MKQQNIMSNESIEFFGKEGFLDVSKPVNFGKKTQETDGINNLTDRSVYDRLIAEKNS